MPSFVIADKCDVEIIDGFGDFIRHILKHWRIWI
jgi:hypothetical protein